MLFIVKVSNIVEESASDAENALYNEVISKEFNLTLCVDKDNPLTSFNQASVSVERIVGTNVFKRKVTFKHNHNVTAVNFPRYVNISATLLGVTKNVHIPLCSYKFVRHLFENKKFYITVSVVGEMGSGKTSLINSACTAVSSSAKPLQPLLAMGTKNHVTAKFDFAPLSAFCKDFRLTLVNTPGFPGPVDDEYKKAYFENLINGTYGDGAPIGTFTADGQFQIDPREEVEKASRTQNKLAASNSIIYVIDGSLEENTLESAIQNAADYIECMSPRNKVIVFTRQDKLAVDKEEIKRFCVDAGFTPESIFFVRNCFDSNTRNTDTDFTCLELLNQLAKDAPETTLTDIDLDHVPGVKFLNEHGILINKELLFQLLHLNKNARIVLNILGDTSSSNRAVPVGDLSLFYDPTTDKVIASVGMLKQIIQNKYFEGKDIEVVDKYRKPVADEESIFKVGYMNDVKNFVLNIKITPTQIKEDEKPEPNAPTPAFSGDAFVIVLNKDGSRGFLGKYSPPFTLEQIQQEILCMNHLFVDANGNVSNNIKDAIIETQGNFVIYVKKVTELGL